MLSAPIVEAEALTFRTAWQNNDSDLSAAALQVIAGPQRCHADVRIGRKVTVGHKPDRADNRNAVLVLTLERNRVEVPQRCNATVLVLAARASHSETAY